MRQNYSTGAKWESMVGYSRAVRVGQHVYVTGTVALNEDGTPHAPGDMYAQAKRSIESIEKALNALGASLSEVVRTRMFVTDISRWEEAGRAHGEAFAGIMPCTTMVEVGKLIGPDFLIEIEADAVLVS